MVERTIRPRNDKEWENAIGGQGVTGSQQSTPQPAGPLEQAVSAATFESQQAGMTGKAAASYPLQLRLDLTNYLYQLLKGKQDLPVTPTIQAFAQAAKSVENPAAYAHAKLLVDNLGPEGFDVRNLSVREDSQRNYGSFQTFRFGSELATVSAIPVERVRNYVTALSGPDALKSPFASDLANASLEDMVEVSSLPTLLPHLPEVAFLDKLPKKAVLRVPFNSPYFIVMEMQPPNSRLLVARAFAAAYQSGSMQVPPQQIFPSKVYGVFERFESDEKRQISTLRQEIPVQILQREAQKLLGTSRVDLYVSAYEKAWDSLLSRLR